LLAEAPTRVVAIVGPTSSGKTSLIASLCNLFQRGRVDTIQFARSRTFFAFEQACHHARAVSRRDTPATEHTRLGSGLGFYHLGMVDDGNYIQLLLSDRPGEDYRSVADDPKNAAGFVEIQRADCILIMVNGELLLDLTGRIDVRQDTTMILQGLKDGDVLMKAQRLAVVLTKLDVIESAPPEERSKALKEFDGIVKLVRTRFGSLFGEVLPFKIAASPATEVLPYAYGSDELLKFWIEPQSQISAAPPHLDSKRAIGRFGMIREWESS
jgi:hypothetical protein